jgi:hypothetical protein
MKEIKEKIIGQRVLAKEILEAIPKEVVLEYPQPNEKVSSVVEVKRPKRIGNTWRLKPPYAEHALYVTFEAITLNGKKYPYEVFFHGKDISHRQWTDTLTLSWSDLFRKAIDHKFSLTSLIANIQDTNSIEGGYRVSLKENEKPIYVTGLVSEIGYIMELFVNECLEFNSNVKTFLEQLEEMELFAMECLEANHSDSSHENPPTIEEKEAVAASHIKVVGSPCKVCGEYAVVKQSGCSVCTECGDTKCE